MSKRLTAWSVVCVVVAGWMAGRAAAEVKLPALFSQHMVLQRDQEVPVWGWAAPEESVTVTLLDHHATATADAEGRWSVKLPALKAGGPYQLVVAGANRIAIDDVWVGEVWLCSGQSNMAMTVNRARNFEEEQAAARFPRIRQFKVANTYAAEPQADCSGQWTVCSPETFAGFSATAYFFAREIEHTLDVPVGIINSSVGGTPIDSWISEEAQRNSVELKPLYSQIMADREAFNREQAQARYEQQLARFREAARAARAEGRQPGRAPRDPVAQFDKKANFGGLFNGMIAPVIGYGFRGALWYQGEANSTPPRAGYYRHQLPLLVQDWRARHGGEAFPFAWVQLPNFKGTGRNWPVVREAMLTATSVPQTGMAVTIDVGETDDIHPKNKQEVGRRLALWALGEVYGQPVARVPRPQSHRVVEGGQLEVELSPAAVSLGIESHTPALTVAAIAGADRKWQPARIEIVDGSRLRFSSKDVAEPVAVRYLWANDPQKGIILTAECLPITPFRTDDWEDVTPFDVLKATE